MASLLTSQLADLTRALEKAAPPQGAVPVPVAADASATAAAAPSTPSGVGVDLPRALDILRSMLSARVTVEDLKVTKAGLLVARLSKSEHADMAKLAKEVMAQWKKAVLPPSAPTGVEQAKAAAAAAAQAKAAADAKKAAEAAAAAAAVAKKKKKESDKKSSGESSSDESERSRDGKKDKKKDKKRKDKDAESKDDGKKKRSKTSPSPTPTTKAPAAAPVKAAPAGSDASLALQHPELARDGPFALFRTDDSQRDKMQWMIYSALGEPTAAAHQALAEEQEKADKAKVDLSQYKSNTTKAVAVAATATAAPEEESKTAPSDAAPDATVPVAAASPTADSTAPASALPADPTPAAIPAVATAAPSLRSRAELAFLIEAAMFNKLGQNSNSSAYKQKYRDLAPQLKDPQNAELNASLYIGRLAPDELVVMSLAALAPAALKDKRAKEAAWSREAARCDIGLDAGATDIFQCDVCKERRCTYFQMQTRGADEPMTIFVTCLVCGNKFRSGDGER